VTAGLYAPAYTELAAEPALIASTWYVYMHLLTRLDVLEAREVKNWALATQLGISQVTARSALDWLVEHGYLIAHERSDRGVRCLRLAYTTRARRIG
jgi:DNA-binding IclR family transcriptional regulator